MGVIPRLSSMSVKIIGLIFVLLVGGCAEETDIDAKIELLKKLAYEGDASAQYHLGLMYYNGNVVPKDYKKPMLGTILQKRIRAS